MPSIAAQAAKEYRAYEDSKNNHNRSEFHKLVFEGIVSDHCIQRAEDQMGGMENTLVSVYKFRDNSFLALTGTHLTRKAFVLNGRMNQAQAQSVLDRTTDPREILLQIATERGAIKRGDFTLSSGQASTLYFDSRLITLDPQGADMVAQELLPVIRKAEAGAVGGPATGAYPIATAIVLASLKDGGGAVPGFIVREEAKAHGTSQAIEGHLPPNGRAAVVDDVCTTGGSIMRTVRAVEARGCEVVTVTVILDRNRGGSEEITRRGYAFHSLLQETTDGTIRPTRW